MTNLSGTNLDREAGSEGTYAGRGLQPRPKRFDAAAIFEPYEKPCGRGNIPPSAVAIEFSQDINKEVTS